jgi:hypothetical protein
MNHQEYFPVIAASSLLTSSAFVDKPGKKGSPQWEDRYVTAPIGALRKG